MTIHNPIGAYTILESTDIQSLDKTEIKNVLESAFNKNLNPDYFLEAFEQIFYEKEYKGIAIIQKMQGIAYLDKFAVKPAYQGSGLGKMLWDQLTQKYPELIWRSSPNNPLNSFYLKKCEDHTQTPNWNIYWINIPQDKINPLITQISTKPPSFLSS